LSGEVYVSSHNTQIPFRRPVETELRVDDVHALPGPQPASGEKIPMDEADTARYVEVPLTKRTKDE